MFIVYQSGTPKRKIITNNNVVTIHAHRGEDLQLTLSVWEADQKTPVNVLSYNLSIEDVNIPMQTDATPIMSVEPYLKDEDQDNLILIRLHGADTAKDLFTTVRYFKVIGTSKSESRLNTVLLNGKIEFML